MTKLTEKERIEWKRNGNQRVEEKLEDFVNYVKFKTPELMSTMRDQDGLDSHLMGNQFWTTKMVNEKHGR